MERSRKQQVKTTRANHGPNFYKEIGSMGGQESTTKFTPESGRQAALKRWQRVRENEINKRKESENDGHQVQQNEDN